MAHSASLASPMPPRPALLSGERVNRRTAPANRPVGGAVQAHSAASPGRASAAGTRLRPRGKRSYPAVRHPVYTPGAPRTTPGGTLMDLDAVLARIKREDVIDLALALGNVDSPHGQEGPVGDFIENWLASN